jgi:hypothetical protein
MMEQKDTLQELFNGYTPDLGQDDLFMQRLEKKLETVEYIKQMQDRQLRRYRCAIIAAFLMGVIVSGGLLVYIMDNPIGQPTFSFGIHSMPFLFLEQNSRMISLTGLSLLMGTGIIVLINLWLELASMKHQYNKKSQMI